MSITSRTIAIVLAMALVAVISIAGTQAAFTGSTSNPANEFDSATIDLTDNDTGITMFNVAGMLPGDTLDHCIEVTYTGPAGRNSNGVKIYIPSYVEAVGTALDTDLLITVEERDRCHAGIRPERHSHRCPRLRGRLFRVHPRIRGGRSHR